jgi:hypothetical protein
VADTNRTIEFGPVPKQVAYAFTTTLVEIERVRITGLNGGTKFRLTPFRTLSLRGFRLFRVRRTTATVWFRGLKVAD